MTTLQAALNHARQRLRVARIEDPDLEAEVLLRHALSFGPRVDDRAHPVAATFRSPTGAPVLALQSHRGVSRSDLFQRLNDPLDPATAATFEPLLQRRLAHEPTAYITGHREFYGLDFAVDPSVLIPRQETETLVETAIRLADAGRRGAVGRLLVADVGTGCGAIAVALTHSLPIAEVYATDLSSDALRLAATNALRHAVARRIAFLRGDLLAAIPERLHLVVANLPYVKTSHWLALPPEIRDHEPRAALDGGTDGLDIIRRFLGQATSYLHTGGRLCLEFGDGEEHDVFALARAAFSPASVIETRPDLAGRPRVLVVST